MQAFLNAYSSAPGRYDELIDPDGRVRPHWNQLAGAISALDDRELAERQADMHRMLVEHGVSYNLYDGDQSVARTWSMDLLPMLVESRVWREIEVGVAQRAELLRRIMHDIYGAQNLLRRGLLPAHIVFAHKGYLLPCMNSNVPLENQLIVYGADLGRAPDGRIWVTGDRTQAPSGIGYALAARTVGSRVLPSLFRESNVHPILPFLRDFRSRLIQLAENDSSRVAILTPGSSNETYSEQAYLARHLGLPLLQGEDLDFHRGACSYVGTRGRQDISVLLRRMDDDFCDPLELNRRSFIGAPGLLQGVRNRRLCFANPLGSGVLENPALMAFLPALCREVLGEDLKLPSQDTWWCGRADDLAYVLDHFDDMVIRSFRPSARQPSLAVSGLNAGERERLLVRIKAQPTEFVAQVRLAQACAPVWQGGTVDSYPLEMRTFALDFNGDYRVMSGGIARAAKHRDGWRFSGQLGGVGKDVWVLSSEPQRAAQTLPQFLPRLQRSQQLTQPHVAENLLWLGRYAARADMLTRMLLQAYQHLAEGRSGGTEGPTQALLRAVTWQTTIYPGFVGPVGSAKLVDPLAALFEVHCSSRAGSLRQDIRGMNDAAEPLRELLVPDVYSLLSSLRSSLPAQADAPLCVAAGSESQLELNALLGVLLRTLGEDSVRSVIEIGLCIEQLIGTVRLIRSFTTDTDCPTELLLPMLHKLTRSPPEPHQESSNGLRQVMENLLVSERNPQSVRYQMMLLERLLRSVHISSADQDRLAARVATELASLGALDLDQLCASSAPDSELAQRLGALDRWLRGTASRIQTRFVPRRVLPQQQLVEVSR